jgi:arginine decarboxylase-like protein
MSATTRFTIDDAADLYGLNRWGNGYLTISADGHLRVTPSRDPSRSVDLMQVVEELGRRGTRSPILLRFPQLLQSQVEDLAGAFANAISPSVLKLRTHFAYEPYFIHRNSRLQRRSDYSFYPG